MTYSRISLFSCLSLVCLLAIASSCVAVESVAHENRKAGFLIPARSFSAVLVEYNRHNDQVKRKTKLTLSRHGMRTEGLNQENSIQQMIFLQDYESSRRWLASPSRACYSELPDGKPVESRDESTQAINLKPSLLSVIPCNGSRSEKISTRLIKNTELSVWQCFDLHGNSYVQHFSTLLGLVIRQESQDGEIGELLDISLVDRPPSYFKPLDQWREVTFQEFITGRTLLPIYEN